MAFSGWQITLNIIEVGIVIVMGRSDVLINWNGDIFVKVVNRCNVKSDHCGSILHKVEVLDPNALNHNSHLSMI